MNMYTTKCGMLSTSPRSAHPHADDIFILQLQVAWLMRGSGASEKQGQMRKPRNRVFYQVVDGGWI
jgi:hypothetical protein